MGSNKKESGKKIPNSSRIAARISAEKTNGASPVLKKSVLEDTLSVQNRDTTVETNLTGHKRVRSGSGEEEDAKRSRMDADMKKFIREELKKVASKEQLEEIVDSIKKNSGEIKSVCERMDKQEDEVNTIRGSIQRLEHKATEDRRGLDRKIKAAVTEAISASSVQVGGAAKMEEKRFEEYDRARRAIRVWPITGESMLELRDGVEGFVMNALLVDDFSQEWVDTVERVPAARRGAAHSEVVVFFVDKTRRDEVFSARTRLATYIDANGKPTSGMRMHIPSFLMPAFKVLESYGYELRKLHGAELRRYIKFEEFERTLFLQVKFPNIEEWFNISVEEARTSRTRKNERRLASAREYFSPEQPGLRERSRSLGESSASVIDTGDEEIQEIPLDRPVNVRGRTREVAMDVDKKKQTWIPKARK